MTVEYCGFLWDSEKNKRNFEKHGIYFEDAIHIFEDPLLVEDFDIAHSTEAEERYNYIGIAMNIVLLFVVATDRNGKTRIISARKATRREVRKYNEQNAQNL